MRAAGARLAEKTLNEAKIAFVFDQPFPLAPGLAVKSLEQWLEVSPASSLWNRTKNWLPMGPLQSRELRTLQSRENYLTFHSVETWPSVLITLLRIEGAKDTDTLYDTLVPLLASSLSHADISAGICGGGGVEAFNPETLSYTVSVPRAYLLSIERPRAYSSLYPKFSLLQPIMVGSFQLCEQLHLALGAETNLTGVEREGSAEKIAILRVPDRIRLGPQAKLAADYLV